MAPHGLSRRTGPLVQKLPPLLDRWDPERLTGSLALRLTTLPGRFVSPGTGRLALLAAGGAEVAAQAAARCGGSLVIPGSGIKGAVRTLFEALSSACDPFSRRCSVDDCCQACAIFGFAGWGGRAGFKDALPVEEGSVTAEVRRVPIPHEPHAEKTGGDFRLYDLDEATQKEKGRDVERPRLKELAREVYAGRFATTLTFWNLWPDELGRLLLAMGLGADEATRFPLRLGGVKYDGQGAVTVEPLAADIAAPRRERLDEATCRARCTAWIAAATASDWYRDFAPQLSKLAHLLNGGL